MALFCFLDENIKGKPASFCQMREIVDSSQTTGTVVQLTQEGWRQPNASAPSPCVGPFSLYLTVIVTVLQISSVDEGLWSVIYWWLMHRFIGFWSKNPLNKTTMFLWPIVCPEYLHEYMRKIHVLCVLCSSTLSIKSSLLIVSFKLSISLLIFQSGHLVRI